LPVKLQIFGSTLFGILSKSSYYAKITFYTTKMCKFHCNEYTSGVRLLMKYHHNRNHFTALFPGTELLGFMVQGKINRGRHTDHPAGRHSIRTNQCQPPPSPPIEDIYRLLLILFNYKDQIQATPLDGCNMTVQQII